MVIDIEDDVRTLSTWLNEELTSPIDRPALARILHYLQQAIDVVHGWGLDEDFGGHP